MYSALSKIVNNDNNIVTIIFFIFSLAPTYESATSRIFFHGRTETTRSCTMEVKAWCEAMFDNNVTVSYSQLKYSKPFIF